MAENIPEEFDLTDVDRTVLMLKGLLYEFSQGNIDDRQIKLAKEFLKLWGYTEDEFSNVNLIIENLQSAVEDLESGVNIQEEIDKVVAELLKKKP